MYSIDAQRLRRCALAILVIVITGILFHPVQGQTDQGRIVGTVTDSTGAIVPGATVAAKNERTGEERTTTTNESGYYIISPLKPSTYTVTVTATNLKAQVTNVQLLVGQELNLGFALQATGVEAKVDISTANDIAIDSGSAAMGVNVNPREVQGLPINGRQVSQLYLQAPGSVNTGSGTFGDIRFSGRAVEQNIEHALAR